MQQATTYRPETGPEANATLLDRATAYVHCAQWESAARILYTVLENDHRNTSALALMALCKWELGETDVAESTALMLVRCAPNDPVGHYLVAQTALYHGDLEAAEDSVRESLRCNPNCREALQLYLTIQRRRHNFSGARDTQRYLQSMHPEHRCETAWTQRSRRWLRERRAAYRPSLTIFCQAA